MQPPVDVQTKLTMTRRSFSRTALASALLAIAAVLRDGEAAAEEGASSKLRNVIKQRLPGDPPRELTLVEVTYPPGTGSPPHLHPNGVMAWSREQSHPKWGINPSRSFIRAKPGGNR